MVTELKVIFISEKINIDGMNCFWNKRKLDLQWAFVAVRQAEALFLRTVFPEQRFDFLVAHCPRRVQRSTVTFSLY
jgi:hypothetical protein